MIPGYIITMIYKLTTVCAGVVITVRPARIRWCRRCDKMLLAVLLGTAGVLRCAGTFWAKYSALELIFINLYLLVILSIFFKVNVRQFFTQHFVYWCNILIFEYCLIYGICYFEKMSFWEYSMHYGVARCSPWNVFHLAAECAVCAGMLAAIKFHPSNKGYIQCRKKSTCLYVLATVFLEWVFFWGAVHTDEYYYKVPEDMYILLLGIVIILLLLFCLFSIVLQSYWYTRQHIKISELNYQFLYRQYDMLHQIYEEKRQQIHNSRNHLVHIQGYLKERRITEAADYVDQLLNQHKNGIVWSCTGFCAVDFMLNYKLAQASAMDIKPSVLLNLLFCPIKDQDMCVILGNLLDNAIEAVEHLDKSKKMIKIFMSTRRNMLIMEITNPYEGERKKAGKHYETTKPDGENHGLGLASVKNIVQKYKGSFEIMDDGKIFTVRISFIK